MPVGLIGGLASNLFPSHTVAGKLLGSSRASGSGLVGNLLEKGGLVSNLFKKKGGEGRPGEPGGFIPPPTGGLFINMPGRNVDGSLTEEARERIDLKIKGGISTASKRGEIGKKPVKSDASKKPISVSYPGGGWMQPQQRPLQQSKPKPPVTIKPKPFYVPKPDTVITEFIPKYPRFETTTTTMETNATTNLIDKKNDFFKNVTGALKFGKNVAWLPFAIIGGVVLVMGFGVGRILAKK